MQHFWQLLFFTVRCRLKSEASTSYLNYGWWVIEPLLHMATFYFVFDILMNQGTPDFVPFLLTGLTPWLWFNKSVINAANSLAAGRAIMLQTRISLSLFPAEVIAQDTVKQGVVFSLLLTFLLLYGYSPNIHWFGLPVLLLTQLVLTAAASFAIAMLVPFLPDFKYLVVAGLQMMMFGSGIFFTIDLILPEHRALFFLNPMANLIHSYRAVLMYGQWPDWGDTLLILAVSASVLALLAWTLHKKRTTYVRTVLEN